MGLCCIGGGCSYGKYGAVILAVAGSIAAFGLINEPDKKADPAPKVSPEKAPAKDAAKPEEAKAPTSFFDFSMKTIDGETRALSEYKGKVILVVNTASACGLTPQYEGLQKLYTDNKDKGLVVLAFPSNDFGGQEPGSASEIKTFCESNYKVTFPIFEKIAVSGADAHPLYKWLTAQKGGGPITPKWNFTKYVVDHTGQVVAGYASKVAPSDAALNKKITELLEALPKEEKAQPAPAVKPDAKSDQPDKTK